MAQIASSMQVNGIFWCPLDENCQILKSSHIISTRQLTNYLHTHKKNTSCRVNAMSLGDEVKELQHLKIVCDKLN